MAVVKSPLARHLLCGCAGLLLLTACAGSPNFAPVVDLHSPPERVPEHYVVRSGDTLYSIAFRYGLDFRGLAAANGIGAGGYIYPGQRLRLVDHMVGASAPVTSSQPAPRSSPARRPSNIADKPPGPVPTPAQKPVKTSPRIENADALTGWVWPAEGKLVRGFSSSEYAHKGIDIAGKMEQPVKAAANGIVVYAGSGLVGYGKLLIVKHSERYLSAYAHNNRLLVNEGDAVKQGQTIARMGDTGTDSTKLHFEIRKDGKPVNPEALLPKKELK